MQEELNFKVSQFIDNDLPVEEALGLLEGIENQPDLRSKLHRYEAVSQAIKTDVFFQVDEDFVSRINKEIQQEKVLFLPCKRKRRIGQSYKTCIAIAASVAIVAVIIVGGLSQSTKQNLNPLQMAVQDEQPFASEQRTVILSAANLQPVNPRYYDYLEAHQGSLYASGVPFQNYSKVVSYGR